MDTQNIGSSCWFVLGMGAQISVKSHNHQDKAEAQSAAQPTKYLFYIFEIPKFSTHTNAKAMGILSDAKAKARMAAQSHTFAILYSHFLSPKEATSPKMASQDTFRPEVITVCSNIDKCHVLYLI